MESEQERSGSPADSRALRENLALAFFALAFLVLAGAYAVSILPSRAPAVAAGAGLVATLCADGLRRALRYQRRFLWRISRKLLVSYSLIAIVPVVLLVFVFAFFTYLAAGQFIAFMAWRQIAELTREVEIACVALGDDLAELAGAAAEVEGLAAAAAAAPGMGDEAMRPLSARFRNVTAQAVIRSLETAEVFVPPGLDWPAGVRAGKPGWLRDDRMLAQLVIGPRRLLEVRSATLRRVGPYEVYAEVAVPLDEQTLEVLQRYIGMDLRILRPVEGGSGLEVVSETSIRGGEEQGWAEAVRIFGVLFVRPIAWHDGQTVREGRLVVTQRSLGGLYRDLYDLSAENRLLIISLLVIVLLGLVVFEAVTLAIGVSLARSITGAVHELSQGTRRIERGDFRHRIRVWRDDQLGELSRSFNRMAVSVERLVRESAERERLEEELRIGRVIQQGLLPDPEWADSRFEVAALSIPAKEVGGDYYDFFEVDADRLGLLVADVSGKGTEAAFYMAEVKGIMLAVTHRFEHPAEILTEANTLLSSSLDRRTFVSMLFAVLDRSASTLEFGRAGHSPLLHLRMGADRCESHRPPGLALGVDRTGGFAACLEPATLRLGRGDIVLLFTDGVTESVGRDGEFFEQGRLERALLSARDGDAASIRDHIAAEIERFSAPGPPHDDLTLIVLRAL